MNTYKGWVVWSEEYGWYAQMNGVELQAESKEALIAMIDEEVQR